MTRHSVYPFIRKGHVTNPKIIFTHVPKCISGLLPTVRSKNPCQSIRRTFSTTFVTQHFLLSSSLSFYFPSSPSYKTYNYVVTPPLSLSLLTHLTYVLDQLITLDHFTHSRTYCVITVIVVSISRLDVPSHWSFSVPRALSVRTTSGYRSGEKET